MRYESLMVLEFDCSVDLTVHHPMSAGLAAGKAVDLVREALETLPGARWVSVAWCGDVPPSLPWLRLYPVGEGRERSGGEWDALANEVKAAVCHAVRHSGGW